VALKGQGMVVMCILLITPQRLQASLPILTSWFHPHQGDEAMVCASRDYPKGTILAIKSGDRAVMVTVRDFGPSPRFLPDRKLDLSPAAFSRLAPLEQGLISVEVHVLARPKGIASKGSIP